MMQQCPPLSPQVQIQQEARASHALGGLHEALMSSKCIPRVPGDRLHFPARPNGLQLLSGLQWSPWCSLTWLQPL